MYGAFIIIAFVTLTHLPGSACCKFKITRDLNSLEDLDKSKWTDVEVTSTNASISVSFDIPVALSYTDAFIFFANDKKEILRVHLAKVVVCQFYSAPYKFKNKMQGKEVTEVEDGNYCHLSGEFPKEWLPENCTKVSAALVNSGTQYYNYYRIQNFEISLPDLMVVEEYGKCEMA